MARIKLTLSANAGGALHFGGHRLLIDALHSRKVPGFSTLDEKRQTAVFAHPDFVCPELICVTHCHPDHYSGELVERARALWPHAMVLLPEPTVLTFGDMQIRYFPLPHDGAEYANTPHYGILLTCGGKNILIPGDCRLADETLLQAVDGRQIDLAILNFPWLTLKKGRECLHKQLQPKNCVFWHLPFAEDDLNGYRRSAEAAQSQYPVALLCDPFQTVELDI